MSQFNELFWDEHLDELKEGWTARQYQNYITQGLVMMTNFLQQQPGAKTNPKPATANPLLIPQVRDSWIFQVIRVYQRF